MSDVFKRKPVDPKKPITADMCLILWGGKTLTTATNLNLQYQQGINRKRTLGTNGKNTAVIYPTMPIGQISIGRLFADSTENIFDLPGWNSCGTPAKITISFTGDSAIDDCTIKGSVYTCTGCVVTNYTLSAEAEGLTVVDNITIEFLQLAHNQS